MKGRHLQLGFVLLLLLLLLLSVLENTNRNTTVTSCVEDRKFSKVLRRKSCITRSSESTRIHPSLPTERRAHELMSVIGWKEPGAGDANDKARTLHHTSVQRIALSNCSCLSSIRRRLRLGKQDRLCLWLCSGPVNSFAPSPLQTCQPFVGVARGTVCASSTPSNQFLGTFNGCALDLTKVLCMVTLSGLCEQMWRQIHL